jgi:hypothetical protein
VEFAHLRFGERVEDRVAAGDEERGQAGRQVVGGEDVHVPAVHVGRGERPPLDQVADAVGDFLWLAGPLPPAVRGPGELQQVGGGVLIELQRPRDGQQHLLGGVLVAALLEPHVIVGTDPGEERDLLAAQARNPPVPLIGNPGVLRAHLLPASVQVRSQGVGIRVRSHVTRLNATVDYRVALSVLVSARPGPCRANDE